MPYDMQTVTAPRLVGTALDAAAALLENPVTRALLAPGLLRDTGIERFRKAALDEAPSVRPNLPRPATMQQTNGGTPDLDALCRGALVGKGFRFESVSDFVRAYREGHSTPDDVARRLIHALKRADGAAIPLRAIVAFNEEQIVAQARASTERWRRKQPLSPFDGVPVAVKDELDLVPYPTTVGTKFLKRVATEDATVAARLRTAGALLFGKANMHEIGIDTSGFNPHHGTPRNPYDPGRYTGGSSSGSGAAVAAGLCPVAVGADGGGSIRIPAALCGVVGLKATFGRVSEAGAFPLCWSVAHVGPLAATARDAALAYALIAGADPRDPNSLAQPGVHLDGLGARPVDGLRLGVYTPWFEHASKEVVDGCRRLLRELERQGARVVEIEIPELDWGRLAHGITILSEMATAMDRYDAEHRGDFGLGVRLNLALARELTARDYVRAQQVRTRLTNHFSRAFESCDVVVTPTTASVAPSIASDVLPRGESNLDMTSALMRFVFPSNLTGHPAISFPAGYSESGIPIGIQMIGRPWEEHLLLRLAEVAEQIVERQAPKVHFKLLT